MSNTVIVAFENENEHFENRASLLFSIHQLETLYAKSEKSYYGKYHNFYYGEDRLIDRLDLPLTLPLSLTFYTKIACPHGVQVY